MRNVILMVIVSLVISLCFTGVARTMLQASGRVSIVDVTADRHTVRPGGRVQLRVNATDSAGCALSYTWRADGGRMMGSADRTPVWTSPREEGQYRIHVTAANAAGSRADAFTDIIVSKYSRSGPS